MYATSFDPAMGAYQSRHDCRCLVSSVTPSPARVEQATFLTDSAKGAFTLIWAAALDVASQGELPTQIVKCPGASVLGTGMVRELLAILDGLSEYAEPVTDCKMTWSEGVKFFPKRRSMPPDSTPQS